MRTAPVQTRIAHPQLHLSPERPTQVRRAAPPPIHLAAIKPWASQRPFDYGQGVGDLGRVPRTPQARSPDSRSRTHDYSDSLAYAFAGVEGGEVDVSSHAGESITGDLMTKPW